MRIRKIALQRGRDVCHGLLKPGIERAAVVLTGGVRRPKRQRELEAAAGHGGAIVRQDRETPVAVERHLELRPLVAEAKPELGEDAPLLPRRPLDARGVRAVGLQLRPRNCQGLINLTSWFCMEAVTTLPAVSLTSGSKVVCACPKW